MTRTSVEEYAEAVRERYLRGTKKEKGIILDESTKATGLHRKAAIRLFNSHPKPKSRKRRGRTKQYDTEVAAVLKMVWEATDRLCCICHPLPT